jgi:hypothetical protein
MPNYHLRRLEVRIGLRDPAEPMPDHKRVQPLADHQVRTSWFIPPPLGLPGVPITPHPLPTPYGSDRAGATLEKAQFAPSDPDALELVQKFGWGWFNDNKTRI